MKTKRHSCFGDGVVIGFIFAWALSAIVMYYSCMSDFRTEAVARGHATWEVKNNGDTEFSWSGDEMERSRK